MNAKHPDIPFTSEVEHQINLSFLDIKLSEILRKNHLKHKLLEKVHLVVFLQRSKVSSLQHINLVC